MTTEQFLNDFMEEIYKERQKQELKWGSQHHGWFVWLSILSEEVGEVNRAALKMISREGDITSLKEEIIQVASVCGALYEQIKEIESKDMAKIAI